MMKFVRFWMPAIVLCAGSLEQLSLVFGEKTDL